jgi:DNA modification methylase
MSSPRPYYSHGGITIYHGDCRDVLPTLAEPLSLVSDPPYPNNAGWFLSGIEAAREVLASPRWEEALVFWTELECPRMTLPLVAVHIWHRTNVNGRPYEPIYHFHPNGEKRRSDLIPHPAVFSGVGPGCREYLGHPTQKPADLMRHLLRKVKGGSVCDPFCGVGATLLAAKDLGRRAVGIELEERYCEIAARRLSQEVLDLGAA